MVEKNVFNFLNKRGLIFQKSHDKNFNIMKFSKKISLYCGFDPTADSLHIGHLLPLICLKHFQNFGHIPHIIIGGATSIVGDPSFRLESRKSQSVQNIFMYQEKLKKQIMKFFENDKSHSVFYLNNYDWFKDLSILNFLKNFGKYFSINVMIHKDSVKERLLKDSSTFLSFTEFSYSLLQAYDYLHLFKNYGVNLQIGGSDQWGNIISGIHLIKKFFKKSVFGLTVPLFKKSNGEKFGKTNSGTIWLDEKKTSPYKFYQFWLNISDKDIDLALKYFTFLNFNYLQELNCLENSKKNILEKKKILADHVTLLVHGRNKMISAQRITRCLFNKDNFFLLQEKDFYQLLIDGVPSLKLKKFLDISTVVLLSNFVKSRSKAIALIVAGAVKINGIVQKNYSYVLTQNDCFFKKYTILCIGKKKHILIFWDFFC